MKNFWRDLILGKGKYIEDYSLYRRAMLLGSLDILCLLIATLYFIMGSRSIANWPYAIILAVSFTSLWLLRKGKYTAAAVIEVMMVNGIIFYFSMFNRQAISVYLFFISNSLGAIALFGLGRRGWAIASVLLSLVLFTISYTGAFGIAVRHTSVYFFLNFSFVLMIGVIVLYFTLRIHDHAEKITQARNAQLQKANAELDRFVYSASHDLRAPLSSILGLIELAQKSNDKKEIENYLGMMKGRIHHLDDFIREIIDYSRNERMEVKKAPVNLHQLVEEAMSNLRFLEGAENINIQNEIPRNLVLTSDAMRLKIVVNNLMNNAIKYHDPTKNSRYIKVTTKSLDEGTTVSVCDNGIGIGMEHLDKVFNMFYRASDKSKGSGLGLYIVRESLGQIGGTVSLKSTLGEGTTFTVLLPAWPT